MERGNCRDPISVKRDLRYLRAQNQIILNSGVMANISLLLYSNIVKTFSVGTSCHLNLFLAGAKQVQIESMEDPVRVLLLFDPVDITILRSLAFYWTLLT